MHNRFFFFFFISRLREALRPSTAKAKVNLFILFSRCVLYKCFWEVHFCLHIRQTVVAPKRNEHRFKCLQVGEYKSCNANLLFIKVTAVFAKGRMSQVQCFLFFFTVSDDECEGCVGQPLCTYGLTDLWTEKQTNEEMLREDQDVFLKRLHASSLCQMKSFARADGKEKSHASPVVELCKKYRPQKMFEAT